MCTLGHRAGDIDPSWKLYGRFSWPILFLTGCVLLLLTGCEDPSNVGLGLAPEEGSSPEQATIAANNVQQTSFASPTGNRSTVVAGQVTDPLFGDISALGYLDIGSPGSFPDAFSDDENDIGSVVFKLHRSYLYGDTTGTTELVLHGMDSDWPASGRSADTSLAAGTEIIRTEIQPTDTLIEISMPDSWIEDHETGLRGENPSFSADFHGFQFSAPDGSVILGFNADGSSLEVTVDDETASFAISKELSTLDRSKDPATKDNRVALQTGIGPAVSMELPLRETVGQAVMNRVRLTLPFDRETMNQDLPANFVRPLPPQLIIYGVEDEENRTPLYTGELDEDDDRYVFDHPQLTNQLQQIILGNAAYERFIVAGATTNSVTVSPVLLYGSGSETQAPSAALTIVPID
jgi:hypothetical protein